MFVCLFGMVKGVYFNNNDFFEPGRYLLKQNEHVLVKVKIIGTLWDSRHLGEFLAILVHFSPSVWK